MTKLPFLLFPFLLCAQTATKQEEQAVDRCIKAQRTLEHASDDLLRVCKSQDQIIGLKPIGVVGCVAKPAAPPMAAAPTPAPAPKQPEAPKQ